DAERTLVRLDGEQVLGELNIPAELSLGIEGRFQRLHWPLREQAGPAAAAPASAASATNAPAVATAPSSTVPAAPAIAGEGSDAAIAEATGAVPLPEEADLEPAALPPLRLTLEDLRVAKLLLGQAELQANPGEHGCRLER